MSFRQVPTRIEIETDDPELYAFIMKLCGSRTAETMLGGRLFKLSGLSAHSKDGHHQVKATLRELTPLNHAA